MIFSEAIMKCRRLRLSCPCGRVARHFSGIGFSPDHQLVIYWHCVRCKNRVFVAKPLSECWRECPVDAEEIPEEVLGAAVHADDLKFLRSLGVRYPEEA
jgi:hypothetical protein